MFPRDFPTSVVTLNKDRIAVLDTLPPGLHDLKLTEAEDIFTGHLARRLEAWVLTEHLANDTERARTRVPASWWDHLRHDLEQWADGLDRNRRGRFVRRLIAKLGEPTMRTLELSVTWSRKGARPMSTLRMPELGPVVYHETTSHDEKWLP